MSLENSLAGREGKRKSHVSLPGGGFVSVDFYCDWNCVKAVSGKRKKKSSAIRAKSSSDNTN